MAKRVRPRIIFLYDHEYPHLWRDGLWAALQILLDDFDVVCKNLRYETFSIEGFNFALGWGGFESPVEKAMRDLEIRKGLCIGGNAHPPLTRYKFDVLFYETFWYQDQIADHPNICHAFGVNTNIYYPRQVEKFIDYLTVGSFSLWKRQTMMNKLDGVKMAIGEIQKGNQEESSTIVSSLLQNGTIVSDMMRPEALAHFYNVAKTCYIPADIDGGGERAILEAKACGTNVKIESDNPKLQELVDLAQPWDEKYYAKQLKRGILATLL